jgi:hypothetical protein
VTIYMAIHGIEAWQERFEARVDNEHGCIEVVVTAEDGTPAEVSLDADRARAAARMLSDMAEELAAYQQRERAKERRGNES